MFEIRNRQANPYRDTLREFYSLFDAVQFLRGFMLDRSNMATIREVLANDLTGRSPAGLYRIALRKEGGLTQKYAGRYETMHKGMLWLQDVPGFDWVYIHTGNKRGHTEGCLLVGDSLNNNQQADGFVGKSRDAYQRIYPQIANAIESGEKVTIRIANFG